MLNKMQKLHESPGADQSSLNKNKFQLFSLLRVSSILGILAVSAWLAIPAPADAVEDPGSYFLSNCASCHSIGGGRKVGPDLIDVTERRSREWILNFIQDPQGMIDRADMTAHELQEEFGMVMPGFPDVDGEFGESLITWIESESASPGATIEVPTGDYTSEDIEAGKNFFIGTSPFENGAPSCMSCHTVAGLGGLGGGKLGPDLTGAYEKFGQRVGLSGWLTAPATATMRPVFEGSPLTPDEINSLVAFLESSGSGAGSAGGSGSGPFLLLGLAGTALVLFLFGLLWSFRFTSVRSNLVDRVNSGGSKQ